MNSRHKKIRVFIFFLVAMAVVVVSVDVLLSVLVHTRLEAFAKELRASQDLSLRRGFTYVDVFKGITVNDLVLEGPEGVLFEAAIVELRPDLTAFLNRKIGIKEVRLRRGRVSAQAFSQGLSLWRRYQPAAASIEFAETLRFKVIDFWIQDRLYLDLSGYVSFVKDRLLVSRGEVAIRKVPLPFWPGKDILKGSSFVVPFDYVFEGEFGDDAFALTRLELSNAAFGFIGKGRLEESSASNRVDFAMDFTNIILDDIPSLNDERLRSRGLVESRLEISGSLTKPQVSLSLEMSNCSFIFFDSLSLTGMSGSASLSDGRFAGQGFSLHLNRVPLTADFVLDGTSRPHLAVNFSSSYRLHGESALVFGAEASWIDDEVVAVLRGRVRYASRQAETTATFRLKGARFGLEGAFVLEAEDLETDILIRSLEGEEIFAKTLRLQKLKGVVARRPNGFALDSVEAVCYGGRLSAHAEFIPANDKLNVRGRLHIQDVELSQLVDQDTGEGSAVFVGLLDGRLAFDNNAQDMYKGEFGVSRGRIEHNPLLNAVADFFGVASLKKISFRQVLISLTGGRGDYVCRVELDAPKIRALLDGEIMAHETMDGTLAVSIPTDVLNESKRFKKLLAYIKHDEPLVHFPFKITSYIKSPRILWLKSEFKEKLQNLLPEGNKRGIQRQVDRMLEDVGSR